MNLFVGELIQIPVDGVHATTIKCGRKDFAVVEFVTTVVNQTRKKGKTSSTDRK